MSWFKIDDGFHCHPKVFAAGTPAVGLYVRCGSWAAQQVTDGIVPKHVAKMYGTPRMIKALIDAGLWHQKGHDCDSCPQLDASSYVIHQYLEKNPSRSETDAARKAKSERQQRWRENKRAAEDADVDASTHGTRSPFDANPEANSMRVGSKTKRNSHGLEDEFASSWGPDSQQNHGRPNGTSQVNDGDAPDVDGDVDASTARHGDAAPVPTRPVPSQVLPSEVPPPPSPSEEPARRNEVEASGRGEVQPLIEAMAARGMNVSWSFPASEWLDLRDTVRRVGVPALVDHAARVWQASKTTPYSARYFLAGWTGLQEPTAYTGPRPIDGPSKTQEYLEDMAAIAEELRQQKGTA